MHVSACALLAVSASKSKVSLGRIMAMAALRGRRPYQEFCFWHNFPTQRFWNAVLQDRYLAMEHSCQFVVSFGCVNPSERTSAEISASVLVMQHGDYARFLSERDIKNTYEAVKVRSCMFCSLRSPFTASTTSQRRAYCALRSLYRFIELFARILQVMYQYIRHYLYSFIYVRYARLCGAHL